MSIQLWTQLRSESLDMDTSVAIVSSDRDDSRLLILLHGLTGNHMQWFRADLLGLARQYNLTIALPDGQRSFWIDQELGLPWGRWVGSELPELLHRQLRVMPGSLIGGLSMGGYGAFRAAFDYPNDFIGAFSLSGTLDISEAAFRSRHPDLYQLGFGSPAAPRSCDDLVARVAPQIPLFACCGTEDRLFQQNLRFVEAHPEVVFDSGPGGHDFQFWKHWLPIAIKTVSQ